MMLTVEIKKAVSSYPLIGSALSRYEANSNYISGQLAE